MLSNKVLKIPKFDGTSHTRNLLVTDRHSQVTSRALHQLHYHVCHRLCLEHVRVGESFCDLWGVWGASTHKAIISSSADRVIHHSVKVIVGHLASGLGHLVRQSTSDSLMRGTKFVVCHATPRTSDTSGRRLGSWHCRPHGAGGQSRRPHSTSDSEQIGSSLDKGRGEPETTPNRSTSISPGPGRMRPMSLANGMQNPHSPSLPASHSQSQRLPGREAIQMNTDRTQTA